MGTQMERFVSGDKEARAQMIGQGWKPVLKALAELKAQEIRIAADNEDVSPLGALLDGGGFVGEIETVVEQQRRLIEAVGPDGIPAFEQGLSSADTNERQASCFALQILGVSSPLPASTRAALQRLSRTGQPNERDSAVHAIAALR